MTPKEVVEIILLILRSGFWIGYESEGSLSWWIGFMVVVVMGTVLGYGVPCMMSRAFLISFKALFNDTWSLK